ncbi:MAG: hypothetical protein ACRC2T_09265 [Thermoguttaceae bacterium]
MYRTIFALLVIFWLTGLVGCRFCGSPYDYCIPTFTGQDCDSYGCGTVSKCDPYYRAGSTFYGTEDACRTSCGGSSCGESTCNSCSTNYNDDVRIQQPVEDTGSDTTTYQNIKKIPPAPAAPAVPAAIPKNVQTTQNAKKNGARTTSARVANETISSPRQVSANPSYAKLTPPKVNSQSSALTEYSEELGDGNITIEELKKLDPDAVDVRILGVENM